jgi:hypothetical protein
LRERGAEMGTYDKRLVLAGVLTALFMITLSGLTLAGGAACVMAKYHGETLDYELVFGKSHPDDAQEAAKDALRERGYGNYYRNLDVMRPQAASFLDSAYVIVIRSEFVDVRGKPRSAMGCGFSDQSYTDAELEAVRDLQQHYWGWKPDQHRYRVVRKFTY